MNYSVQWLAAWGVFIVGVVCGVLAGADRLGAHPSWLTPDVAATATLIAAVCVPLGAVLPQLQRTPSVRETNYLIASQGKLPDDIAQKYPTIIPPREPPDELQ